MSKLEFTLLDRALITSRGLNHVRKLGVLAAYQGGTNRIVFDNRLFEELAPAWGVTKPQYVAAIGRLQNWPSPGWLTRVENSRYDLAPTPGPGGFLKVPNVLFRSGLSSWAVLGIVSILAHPAERRRDLFSLYKVSVLKEHYPSLAHFMPQERKAAAGKRGGWCGQCDKARRFADALEISGVVEIIVPRRPRAAAKVKVHITDATIDALKVLAPWTVAISEALFRDGDGRASRDGDDGGLTQTVNISGGPSDTIELSTVAISDKPAASTVATSEPALSLSVKNERPRETQESSRDPRSLKKGPEQEHSPQEDRGKSSQPVDASLAAKAASGDELRARDQESGRDAHLESRTPSYSWKFAVPPDLDPEDLVAVPMDPEILRNKSYMNCVRSRPGILLAADQALDTGTPFLVPGFFASALSPDFVYSFGRPAATLAEGRTAGGADAYEQSPRHEPQEEAPKALPEKDALKARESARRDAGNSASDSSGDKGYRAFVRLYNSVVHGARCRSINLGHAPPKSLYVSGALEPKVRKAWGRRRDCFRATFVECLEAVARSRFLLGLSKGMRGNDGSIAAWELNPVHLLSCWDDVLAGKYEGLHGDEVRPIVDRLRDPLCRLLAECRDRGASPREAFDAANCGWFSAWEAELVIYRARRLLLEAKRPGS